MFGHDRLFEHSWPTGHFRLVPDTRSLQLLARNRHCGLYVVAQECGDEFNHRVDRASIAWPIGNISLAAAASKSAPRVKACRSHRHNGAYEVERSTV
jgi:hypothetical protein